MGLAELKTALQEAPEVELTTTGRVSGKASSRPIWFVEEDERILLLPVSGSDSNWYRNIRKNPEIRLTADDAELETTAQPIDDAAEVDHVVEEFSAKYGAGRVKEYYPKTDAAVRVPLG